MKKFILLLYLFFLAHSICQGQAWLWSSDLTSANTVAITNVAVDDNDNVYLIGDYETPSLTIQGVSVTNAGDKDAFLCKFSSDGTLQWLRGLGGSNRDFAVALSIVGNSIFVSGDFRNADIYFTPTDFLVNTNNFDAYLAEYDLDGNFIMASRLFHGADIQRIKGMVYSSTEDLLLFIGQYKTELTYNDGTTDITINPRGAVGKDHFLIKSNLNGEIQDTAFFQTTQNGTILKGINLATNEGYYVTGDVFDLIEFSSPSNTLTGTNATAADAFVAKFNTNLDFQWARRGGASGYDHVNSSVSDRYGNIYITGKVETTVTFDSTATLQSSPVAGFGAQDLYLTKYNKNGTLQWIKRKGSTGNDDGFGLTQKENLIEFCGNISGEVIFNVDTLTSTGSTDVNTGFAIFDLTGNEIGAQGIGGSGLDRGEAIAFNSAGNTVIAGIFDSPTITIGASTYTNSSGTNNGFVAQYYYPMNAVFSKVTQISCNGNNTGRLIVTPYFGVGPYTYTWSANVTDSNDSLAFNLPAGSYSVTVTDSRAEEASTFITLTEPSAINIAKTTQSISCHPADGVSNNGAINLTVSGGTEAGTYIFSWEAVSGSGINPIGEDQSNLTAGTYVVTVTDDNLCKVSDTTILTQPPQITFGNSDAQPEIDPPGGNGSIDLEISGGTPAYNIAWTGPGAFTSSNEDISNLAGGSYTVTINDANLCSADTSFLVSNALLLIASITSKTDVDCKDGDNGSATVGVTGGVGPYTYAWTNSGGTPIGGSTATLPALAAGTYYVTVTDTDDSDEAQTSVVINEPTSYLISSISGTDLTCFNDGSGIVNLTVSGGTLPYNFSWNNGAATEDLVNLGVGTYSVVITDANGCQNNEEVTLTQPSSLGLLTTINQEILCNGDLTGRITASANGGTVPYTYQWDDPGNQSTAVATGLEAGTYSVTVTDLVGCETSEQVTLVEPAQLNLSAIPQNVSCFGEEDGSINLSTSGGTPIFNYAWSNGALTQDIIGLAADTYSVIVTDANDCEADLEVTITEPPQIQILSIDSTNITCLGDADGSIAIQGAWGTGALTYSIDNGANFSADSSFADLAAGTYQVLVADANDCQSVSEQVELTAPEATNILSEVSSSVSCNGDANGSITISAQNSFGGLEYSIDGGSNYLANSGIFESLEPGSYQILIRDANGCVVQSSELTVTEPEILSLDTTITHATHETGGSIQGIASGGTSPFNYYVQGDTTLSNTDGSFVQISEGNYTIFVIDDNTCTSDTLEVLVKLTDNGGGSEDAVTVYDAFSPNKDGINDEWNIGNIENFPNCTVIILNSWGNKVFTSDGYSEAWDGTYNGNNLPAGTYYYIIDLGEGSSVISGPVSLIR